MNFKIQILGESKSGNSYFVKASEAIKTPFGDMLSEVGIGYITKNEGINLTKGDIVDWKGNLQFNPIVVEGEVSTVNNQYLHRINLVSAEMPFIAPVQAKVVEAAKPAVKEEVETGVPTNDDQPF